MRILLLPQSYPPRVGGLEAVAHALAVQLAGRGHEVRVLTNRYPRDLPRHEVRDGIDVQRALFLAPRAGLLARWRLDLWLASLPLAPAAGRRLRRLVEEFRPDVVNVHFPDAMIPFVLALRRAHRFRLVVSLHGHEVMRFGGGAAARGGCRPLCRLLREADAVTACSGDLLDAAARLEPAAAARGVVIHNGIDPARFGDTARFAHPRPYVLATRVGGLGEFLDQFVASAPGNAPVVLVPPSPDGLAEGLRACLRSEWLAADRREAARTILQDWTWSQAAQKYEEVLAG